MAFALIGILVLFCVNHSTAQWEKDYSPIRMEGRIPDDFLRCVKGNTKLKIETKNVKSTAPTKQQKLQISTSIQLREIFLAGQVYYNDTLSNYIAPILQRLIKNNPTLQTQVSLFVTRFPSVNATSWQDGTILLNLGLLKQLENEAQLAFIIGHELAHYVLKHGLEGTNKVVEKQPTDVQTALSKVDYSFQNEILADKYGLELMEDAGYDPNEAMRALELLEIPNPSDLNIAELFSSTFVKIQEDELCSPSEYREYMKPNMPRNGRYVLSYSMQTRIAEVRKLISSTKGKKFIRSEKDFETVRTIAGFELIECLLSNSNFLRGSYEAILLQQKYPDNRFLQVKVLEGLLGIAQYSKSGKLEAINFDNKQIDTDNFAIYYCFFNVSKDSYIQQISSGYIEKIYNKYKNDGNILIILAQIIELNSGLETAKPFYEKYANYFPRGKYITLATLKTE